MDEKTEERIGQLTDAFYAAKKRGEGATAMRLLTRLNRLKNGDPEIPEGQETRYFDSDVDSGDGIQSEEGL